MIRDALSHDAPRRLHRRSLHQVREWDKERAPGALESSESKHSLRFVLSAPASSTFSPTTFDRPPTKKKLSLFSQSTSSSPPPRLILGASGSSFVDSASPVSSSASVPLLEGALATASASAASPSPSSSPPPSSSSYYPVLTTDQLQAATASSQQGGAGTAAALDFSSIFPAVLCGVVALLVVALLIQIGRGRLARELA